MYTILLYSVAVEGQTNDNLVWSDGIYTSIIYTYIRVMTEREQQKINYGSIHYGIHFLVLASFSFCQIFLFSPMAKCGHSIDFGRETKGGVFIPPTYYLSS